LKDGSKSDRIDARKLAELLRGGQLKPVYHGEHGLRTLKELGRSYLTLTKDVSRVMTRIKALYRNWAIPCSGATVYAPRHRAEWLAKIAETGVRLRAERFYQQLDLLQPVPGSATRPAAGEPPASCRGVTAPDPSHRSDSRRFAGGASADPTPFPQQATAMGLQRFRHPDSRQRRVPLCAGKTQRNRERITVRGLNHNHNHDLKNLFKGAAISASTRPGPLRDFYGALLEKGMRPTVARLTLARKMAAITLTIWKKGVDFDAKQLHRQAA